MTRMILLVEDEQSRSALRERLLRMGYVVFATSSSIDVLHILAVVDVDGIVLDLDIRMLDATMLLKEIRRHHPDVPILVIATPGDVHELLRAIRYGATDYLVRPVDHDLLRHKCLRVFPDPTSVATRTTAEDRR